MSRRALMVIGMSLALAGCERAMHDMYKQAKYKPLEPSAVFDDGNSSRPQVAGTVPRSAGTIAGASSGRRGDVVLVAPPGSAIGVDAQGRSLARGTATSTVERGNPLPITARLLARGRERFDIFCAPCHSRAGDGNGMIARRGFPAPPSYHAERLRKAPDSHFYDVISDGYGAMYSYADRVAPEDRWAIVAYIRALQLSQHAPASVLSAQDRTALGGTR